MDNKIRYFKAIVFILAALNVLSFMNMHGLNSGARYQYGDFSNPVAYRTFADVFLLVSSIFMASRNWRLRTNDIAYVVASIVYVAIILVDINVWLWWIQWNVVYWEHVIVHTLPLLVIFNQLIIGNRAKMKYVLIGGVIIFVSGFIYDVVFINIPAQDITDELFKKNIVQEKVRNLFYFFGACAIIIGLAHLALNRKDIGINTIEKSN